MMKNIFFFSSPALFLVKEDQNISVPARPVKHHDCSTVTLADCFTVL